MKNEQRILNSSNLSEKNNMLLSVHVKPGAKQNKLEWMDQDTLKLWVTALAEKGKANEAVLELLAEELKIPKSRLQIVRGLTTRLKHIEIQS